MIFLLGDVHGGLDHILPAIRTAGEESNSVVFLGDIEPRRPFEEEIRPLLDAGIEVWFIHGNHDSDRRLTWDNLEASSHRNLHGRVVEIDGVRIGGLGGTFREDIWYPDQAATPGGVTPYRNYADYVQFIRSKAASKRRPTKEESAQRQGSVMANGDDSLLDESQQGRLLKHLSAIFPDSYDALADQQADILVTHEAPSCHPHGFGAIDLLAQVMGVKALFHGHQHDSLDYRQWDTELGFRAYGVGFRGITDYTGKKVLAGDLDEARRYRETHPTAAHD